ncbi:MAG: DsrE family protein [Phyllobacteriaceae bacterium]|nr:DsrE family protein [Phyllobacteriaceae bacterium]
MRMFKNTIIMLFAAMAILQGAVSANADAGKPGLFINLTTDDTWSAAKAIMFAHEKALKNGHSPVAIWMNVRAVYLADKKRASHVHGLMRESNMSIQDMLAAFIKDGGTVIMCQACSKAAGLTQADYIDGVTMGSWELIESILFDPNVKTLSW